MCVIAIYEKNLELNEQELRNCFRKNPDGAGFMYFDQKANKVHVSKGYFTFDELWKQLETLPTDVDRIIHFRIATSGAINTSTCHPFPVCDDLKQMGRGEVYCDEGLAHNGILREYTPKKGMKSRYSDTMYFTKQMVHPLGEAIMNKQVQDLLEEHTFGNKFAILNHDQLIVLGDFEQSRESLALYSNSSYYARKWESYYYDFDWDIPTKGTSKKLPETFEITGTDLTGYGYSLGEDNFDTFPIELWTGKCDPDLTADYIDTMYDLCYNLDVFIGDWEEKEYSIVFYVDRPEILLQESIQGKKFTMGNCNYQKKHDDKVEVKQLM